MLLTYVILMSAAIAAYRLLTRKRRREKKRRRKSRRRARVHHGMNRTIMTRGIGLGQVRMCSCGCGRTAGHCREMTARAEHPKGMLGPRKKHGG